MNGGIWGGEADTDASGEMDVEYSNSPPITEHVTFTITRGNRGIQVAESLRDSWNTKPSRPRVSAIANGNDGKGPRGELDFGCRQVIAITVRGAPGLTFQWPSAPTGP